MKGTSPPRRRIRYQADLFISTVNQKVRVDNNPVSITPMEYRLLALLAKSKETIVPYDRISSEVWDREYSGDNENIRIFIGRLRNKLRDTLPNMIINKRGAGYMLKS